MDVGALVAQTKAAFLKGDSNGQLFNEQVLCK